MDINRIVGKSYPNRGKAFISGAISADPDEAKLRFQEAEDYLRRQGYNEVFNPTKEIDPVTPWLYAMHICLDELASSDLVYILDSNEYSCGSEIEQLAATRLDIQIEREND